MIVKCEDYISVVVPVKNEQNNISPLLKEISRALSSEDHYEVIYVDDGSSDATLDFLKEQQKTYPILRVMVHNQSYGQSAAIRTGVLAARGDIIVTLDGDGQNDPSFIPEFIRVLKENKKIGLVAGQRIQRKSSLFKNIQSKIANNIRNVLLNDNCRDSGCGLKAIRKHVFLQLPYFSAIHRFLPALVSRSGYKLFYVDIVDRSRISGVSNYGFLNRFFVSMVDLIGVLWLIKRHKIVLQTIEIENK